MNNLFYSIGKPERRPRLSADALLQLDTPALTQIKAYELEELFLDCSMEEKKAILDMAAETKKILRKFEGGLEKA